MEEILSGYLNKTKGEMNVTDDGIREVLPMTCEYRAEYDFGLFPSRKKVKMWNR